jgi:hypothetical protein
VEGQGGIANFALVAAVTVAIVAVAANVIECSENFVSIYLLHERSELSFSG